MKSNKKDFDFKGFHEEFHYVKQDSMKCDQL